MMNTKNSQHVYLSYSMGEHIPAYGKFQLPLPVEIRNCPSKGSSCTSYWVGLENHWGTHIDAPKHFFPSGKKVSDYPADFWIFHSPQVISVEVKASELIYPEHLQGKILEGTDCLLLHTGFGRLRDQKEYCIANPGVHSSVGVYLRKNYPHIRVIGFDFISLSSFQNRDEGRKSHRAFLDPEGENHPILILEDVNLQDLHGQLSELYIFPLRIEAWDSASCTVIGRVES